MRTLICIFQFLMAVITIFPEKGDYTCRYIEEVKFIGVLTELTKLFENVSAKDEIKVGV